jgi:hypothetical protein
MSSHNHMPPVPPANRSTKGPGDKSEFSKDKATSHVEVNTAEQGDTANIRQNTPTRASFRDAG